MSRLATILDSLMESRGLSATSLAHQLSNNPSVSTISRILSDEITKPRRQTLMRLAHYFGITVKQLLGEDDVNVVTLIERKDSDDIMLDVDDIKYLTVEHAKHLSAKILEKGMSPFKSRHEALGAITEEFWEFVQAVQSNDEYDYKQEALDLAVASIWALTALERKE